MQRIIMHDVGDGNHVDIVPEWRRSGLKVDFGTNSDKKKLFNDCGLLDWIYPLRFGRSFMLSHFHADHYNGLIELLRHANHEHFCLGFRKLYYPRFPTFPNSTVIAKQILYYNRLLLGDYSGSQQYDLIRIVSKLNRRRFTSIPLSQGDLIQDSSMEAEVLWPPRTIANNSFNRTVERVIGRFEETISHYPELRDQYVGMNGVPSEHGESEFNPEDLSNLSEPLRNVPQEVVELGVPLRNIANRLSIAFLSGRHILFLGDLENYEIYSVVKYLKKIRNFNHSEFMIAPHHGTHWQASMINIFANHILVSNGPKMIAKFKQEYKQISNRVHSTFLEGTVVLG